MLMHSLTHSLSLHVARLLISSHVSLPSLTSPRLASLTPSISLIGQEGWNKFKGEFKHSGLFHAVKRYLNGSRFCSGTNQTRRRSHARKRDDVNVWLPLVPAIFSPSWCDARTSCSYVETTSWCSHQPQHYSVAANRFSEQPS